MNRAIRQQTRTCYVKMPNVNTLLELADMRETNRSYEANLKVMTQAREMVMRHIDLSEDLIMINEIAALTSSSDGVSEIGDNDNSIFGRCRPISVERGAGRPGASFHRHDGPGVAGGAIRQDQARAKPLLLQVSTARLPCSR